MKPDTRMLAFRDAASEALRWSKHAEGGAAHCVATFREKVAALEAAITELRKRG